MSEMNCDQFFEALTDGDEKTVPDRARHMEKCEACRAGAARIAEVNALLKNPEKVKIDTTGLKARALAAGKKALEEALAQAAAQPAPKPLAPIVKIDPAKVAMPRRKAFLMAASFGIVTFAAGLFAGQSSGGRSGGLEGLRSAENTLTTLGEGNDFDREGAKLEVARGLYEAGYPKAAAVLAREILKGKWGTFPAYKNDADAIVNGTWRRRESPFQPK